MISDITKNLILLSKSKLLAVLAILPAVVSAMLMSLPLFEDFDYEFNEAMCVVVFLTAMAITIILGRRLTPPSEEFSGQIVIDIPETNLYILKYSLLTVFLSLSISFIVITLFLALYGMCSLNRGLSFFLLLPVTAGMVGCSVGYWNVVLFKKFAWVGALFWVMGSLVLNILWLKWRVPIYVYSVSWGYFPGPIYDEWIPITTTLWLHRLWSLCFAALLVVTALMKFQRPVKGFAVILISVVILLSTMYAMRFRVGFDATYEDVRSELSATMKSDHVIIYFDPGLDREEMKWIQSVSEYYYERICLFLNIKSTRTIAIYVYRDDYQKKELMGAGRTNFAKIVNDEIHINYEDVEGVLKHEMTHVLANEFGSTIYGTMRIGFLEGLAVAADWNEDYFTPHEWAAALKKQNELPDIASLIDGGSFFTTSSGMSYIVSGSFTRFLIDSFGVAKFKRAYREEDIEKVYGMTTPELTGRWMRFLNDISLSEDDTKLAALLIRPSLFQKKCPHFIADILEKAGSRYINAEYVQASALYQKALSVDRENYRIMIAQIRSMYHSGEIHPALCLLDSLILNKRTNFISQALLLILKGDMLLSINKRDSAFIMYQDAVQDYNNIPSIYTSAKLRLELMRHGQEEALRSIVTALNIDEQVALLKTLSEKEPDLWASRYWLAQLSFQRGVFRDVIRLLKDPPEGSDSVLLVERLKMQIDSYVRLGRYDIAEYRLLEGKNLAIRDVDREFIVQKKALLNWLEQRSN